VLGLAIGIWGSLAAASCGHGTPAAPTAASDPQRDTIATIELPIAPGDAASVAYGIWPFGVHGSSHAVDGHPGFDVEYRVGASVRAAADGTIHNLSIDPNAPGRYNLRIMHVLAGVTYATDYTNINSLAPGIAAGRKVTRGQPLGLAGVQTLTIGSSPITFAMTHFQVNDFRVNDGLTNPNAISPEVLLSPSSRALFNSLWATAAYVQEFTEPLATNPRGATFPLTRSWTTTDDPAIPRIDVRRASATASDQSYEIRSASGDIVESGVLIAVPHSGLSTVDLVPVGRAARLGVVDIVGTTMRLALGAPGAARPTSLAGAKTYVTR
jgi:hypothetical protein